MAEVLKSFSTTIDLKKQIVNEPIKVVEGDNGNVLVLSLVDDSVPVSLEDCLVQIVFAHSGGTVWQDSSSPSGGVSIGGDNNNEITVRLHSASFNPNGLTECEIKIYSGEALTTLVTAVRFTMSARLSLLNADTVESIELYSILVTLINSVQGVLDDNQADWDETNPLEAAYIKNKPVVGADIQENTDGLTEGTTLSDPDAVPFYDASEAGHRKITWLKIRTLLFGSITGLVKADGAGNISVAVANTDYAAAGHQSRHSTGAPDALSDYVSISTQSISDAGKTQARSNISAAKAVSGLVDAMEARVPADSYTDSITISASNLGRDAHVNSSSDKTVTFPELTEGYYGFVTRDGSGSLTMVAGSGVSFHASGSRLSISEQYGKIYYSYISSTVVELQGGRV